MHLGTVRYIGSICICQYSHTLPPHKTVGRFVCLVEKHDKQNVPLSCYRVSASYWETNLGYTNSSGFCV